MGVFVFEPICVEGVGDQQNTGGTFSVLHCKSQHKVVGNSSHLPVMQKLSSLSSHY